jgi:toxin YoeB
MMYTLKLTPRAQKDIQKLGKSGDKRLLAKLDSLFGELEEHPETGTGKPEKLKHITGYWSRRLNKKHRLVYSIDGEEVTVTIVAAYGHYD